jgi:hypothetical protein
MNDWNVIGKHETIWLFELYLYLNHFYGLFF